MKIAFQGEAGAYSEQAALEYCTSTIETVPCHSFDDVFEIVGNGMADSGILPIENSLAGSIHRNYDLLLRHDLSIIAEYHLRVSHCLLALPGVALSEIKRVHSHPQALAQCEASLLALNLEQVVEADTAGSARWLSQQTNTESAAIASRRAAEVYGLQILREHLEDNPANFTRFLILAADPVEIEEPDKGSYKTSIVFSLNNQPGVLFKAMSVFALRDIDLTKIESRPLPGYPWEYIFYIDFVGHYRSPVCARALEHLSELATYYRLLGSYPRHLVQYQDV
jgi:prephenate dehydratase